MKKGFFFILLLISFSLKAQLSIFNVNANDITYSEKNNLLYAIISCSDINYGNCLIAINPNSGKVLKHVYIGCEPLRIKLTNDQRYAYVSFSGIGYIKRIDLSSFTIDKEILLGPIKGSTTAYALDFEIIPNSNEKIAVCRTPDIDFYNFDFVDLVLYVNGEIQPKKINDFSNGFSYEISQIVAKSDGKTLFGYNSRSSSFDCYYISVTDSGVVLQNTLFNSKLLETYGRIKINDDTLYAANGRVIKPFSSQAEILGTCPVDFNDKYYSNQFALMSSKFYDSYIFSNPSYHSLPLDLYSKKDYSLKKSYTLNIPNELITDTYFVENLVEISNGHFAILLSDHIRYKVLMFFDPLSNYSYIDSTLTSTSNNLGNGIAYSTINIKALDQVYSWKNEKLFAVVSGEDSSYPNSIVKINPINNKIEDSLKIGNEPYRIKLTSDQNYAYVAFRKSNCIKRINLTSFNVDKIINLTSSGYYSSLYASDFEILPNTTDKIVVCRASTADYDSFVDLALYTDTIINPNTISKFDDGGSLWITQIVSKLDGKYLFGFNSQNTGFDCYIIEINDSGLVIKNSYNNLVQSSISAPYFPKIKNINDEIIGSTGKIVDAFSNPPIIKGVCPSDFRNTYYGFTTYEYLDAYIFTTHDNTNLYLNLFSKKTYSYLGSVVVKNVNDYCFVKSIEVIDKDHLSLILTKNSKYYSYLKRDEYMINVNLSSPSTWIPNEVLNDNNSIDIYPNPTDGILNISTNEDISNISIYSLDGILRLSSTGNNLTHINMEFLSDGIYIVKLNYKGGKVISKKIFKY